MYGWTARCAAFLCSLFLLAGCGGGSGNLTGKVVLGAKTVKFGTVTFVASDGKAFVAEIADDGRFSVRDIPVGEAKVAVTSLDPRSLPSGTRGGKEYGPSEADRKNWFPLPPRYSDPSTSGLTRAIRAGDDEWIISLEGRP